MKKRGTINKLFKYIEPLWLGIDNRISLRAVAAIALVIDFISSMSHAVYKWDSERSLEGLSLILGIEAGLITALLGLTAWSNMSIKKLDNEAAAPSNPTVKINNVETINTNTKPDNPE